MVSHIYLSSSSYLCQRCTFVLASEFILVCLCRSYVAHGLSFLQHRSAVYELESITCITVNLSILCDDWIPLSVKEVDLKILSAIISVGLSICNQHTPLALVSSSWAIYFAFVKIFSSAFICSVILKMCGWSWACDIFQYTLKHFTCDMYWA
jgi:hypothetical protein